MVLPDVPEVDTLLTPRAAAERTSGLTVLLGLPVQAPSPPLRALRRLGAVHDAHSYQRCL